MNQTHTVEKEANILEQKFLNEANRILLLQKEIEEIRAQLEIALMEVKQLPGKVAQFEKMIALKEISELLEVKERENERLVVKLHNSVFPRNIFVGQEFFDFAIATSQGKIVEFKSDWSTIAVLNSSELS